MKNKVGTKQLSDAELSAIQAEVQKIKAALAPVGVKLTAEERQSAVKFRPGGEEVVTELARLAKQHNATIPGVNADDMLADLKLAQQIAPVAKELEEASRLANDTLLEAQGECWWAALAYYSLLLTMSRNEPALADHLQPIVKFFAIGKRKAKPE
jgi:hypothetical protein